MIRSTTVQQAALILKAKIAQHPHYHDPIPEVQRPGRCKPGCESCGGSGWVRPEVPVDDFRFGILQSCPKLPVELMHEEGRYGLTWEERELRWENVLDLNDSLKAVEVVKDVIERGSGWVFLWGKYGNSKTRVLKTAVAEAINVGQQARYTRTIDLLDDLRAAYDEDDGNRSLVKRVARYTNTSLLALDEIDRFKETDWARERLFQILDRRYTGAEVGRTVTLIASNTPLEELDGYLASRLYDGRFVRIHMDGEDIRAGL